MFWRLLSTSISTTVMLTPTLAWDMMRAVDIWSPLHWRHNDHDSVSNHQPHDCLLNGLFRRRSKKTSKLRVTGLCVGNSTGPVNSPHKWPVTRKMFPFDDVIMHSWCWVSKKFQTYPLIGWRLCCHQIRSHVRKSHGFWHGNLLVMSILGSDLWLNLQLL